MASRSSPPRSGLSNLREEVIRLLREGGTVAAPSERLRNAAEQLRKLGLIAVQYREYVLCANPQDRDFPPKNRNCPGRIYLQEGLDEPGYDYRCPECERPVFPTRHDKNRSRELRVALDREGILKFINDEISKVGAEVKVLADGVFHVAASGLGVVVCVVDFCTESKYQTQAWATSHPTCYIAIGKRATEERFLAEDWLVRFCLGDILCGTVDICETIRSLASGKGPRAVLNASLPVYTPGPMPAICEPLEPAHADRRFVVEVGEKTVKVEGEIVIAAQAGPRLRVFRILWTRFLEDMAAGRAPEDYRPINLNDIIKSLDEKAGTHTEDATSVRRIINNLQSDIETTVKKKLGLAIGREDIAQTCKWKGQTDDNYGYRINPATVAARPFQPSKA